MTRRTTPEQAIANFAAKAPAEISESPAGNPPIPSSDASPVGEATALENVGDRQSSTVDEHIAPADQAAERAVEPLDDGYEPL